MTESRHTHRVNFNCLVEFATTECCHICELVDISLQGDSELANRDFDALRHD